MPKGSSTFEGTIDYFAMGLALGKHIVETHNKPKEMDAKKYLDFNSAIEDIITGINSEITRIKKRTLEQLLKELINVELNEESAKHLTRVYKAAEPGKEYWYWKFKCGTEEAFLVSFLEIPVSLYLDPFHPANAPTIQIAPSLFSKIPLEELGK